MGSGDGCDGDELQLQQHRDTHRPHQGTGPDIGVDVDHRIHARS